eukprot:365021-Chlamydomonas_euryale.AAC.5
MIAGLFAGLMGHQPRPWAKDSAINWIKQVGRLCCAARPNPLRKKHIVHNLRVHDGTMLITHKRGVPYMCSSWPVDCRPATCMLVPGETSQGAPRCFRLRSRWYRPPSTFSFTCSARHLGTQSVWAPRNSEIGSDVPSQSASQRGPLTPRGGHESLSLLFTSCPGDISCVPQQTAKRDIFFSFFEPRQLRRVQTSLCVACGHGASCMRVREDVRGAAQFDLNISCWGNQGRHVHSVQHRTAPASAQLCAWHGAAAVGGKRICKEAAEVAEGSRVRASRGTRHS